MYFFNSYFLKKSSLPEFSKILGDLICEDFHVFYFVNFFLDHSRKINSILWLKHFLPKVLNIFL